MDLGLKGKRAIVTGASRGIGKVVARQLAAEGCDVVIVGRQSAPLQAAAETLNAQGAGRVFAVVGDAADDASVTAMVAEAVALMGGIDILVNTAAVGSSDGRTLADTGLEALADNLNIKLMGYMRTSRAVAPHMVAGGWGRIINIGGSATRTGGSYPVAIRNAAITALTGNLAGELGGHGVTVNIVHPGPTITDERAPETGEGTKLNTIGRMPTAEEVAYVATMLASPLGAAVNGESILASGGRRGAISY